LSVTVATLGRTAWPRHRSVLFHHHQLAPLWCNPARFVQLVEGTGHDPPHHLVSAIIARDNAIAEITAIEAKMKKLEAHAQSSSPATIELAQLRAENTAAFAAWSDARMVLHPRSTPSVKPS
jgi:hypothetical protein